MRIAIVTSVYAPMINGVAVFSHNLAKGLASRGNEVMVLTPSQTGKKYSKTLDGVKVEYLTSKKIYLYPDQIHDVPDKKKTFYKDSLRVSLKPGGQIKKILGKFKPEVIHVQGSDPVGVAAVKYAHTHNIPVILTEHNQPEVLTEPLHLPKIVRRPVNNMISSYFVRRQKKVDFVTMPTELSIKHLLKDKKINVPMLAVSNGVDLSAFKPGKAPNELYDKYGIPSNVPIILYIGRLDPEKKVGVALDAFADFLDKHKFDRLSKTLFVVVGDGVDKNPLMTKADKMGLSSSVKFLGRVVGDDLYNIYRMGDIFVTASEIETQGIVLIEAAATGLPLIAVDAGAVAEVCKNGENGFLLKPGDSKGISEAISKILSNDELRKKMSKKSIEIANSHSLEKTIDKFIEIYQKVCYNS